MFFTKFLRGFIFSIQDLKSSKSNFLAQKMNDFDLC